MLDLYPPTNPELPNVSQGKLHLQESWLGSEAVELISRITISFCKEAAGGLKVASLLLRRVRVQE